MITDREYLINLYKSKYSPTSKYDFTVQDFPPGHDWVWIEGTDHICTKCSQKIVLLREDGRYDKVDALVWFLRNRRWALPIYVLLTCPEAVMKRALV